MRARLENIPILLGSATPSLESWHNAQRGQYTLLTPAQPRAGPAAAAGGADRSAPRAAAPRPASRALSPTPGTGHARRPGRRRAGDAAAQPPRLLDARPLPGVRLRRGVPLLRPGADLSPAARRDAVPLLRLRAGAAASSARSAAGRQVRYQGLGTEKLQAEIEEKFPGYVVRRMDSDTMKRPGSHARVLDGLPPRPDPHPARARR